jgi:glyoxylase-like metal-dependent hydrolase (beta-lactamase superfamily II)
VLIEAGPAVLGPFDERLQRYTTRTLERMGVEVRCATLATAIDRDGITVRNDDSEVRIEARTKVWAAGVQASPLAKLLASATGAETDRAGRIMVEPDCTLPGHPEVFAIGDMVSLNGLPGIAGSLAGHLATWMPYLHSVVDPTNRVHGGEVMQIGGDAWELVHTPGHSLGHICLWSPRRRAILSGDHLLPSITPPVTFERGFEHDPLRSYLMSLRAVADRRPSVVLPGHGAVFGHVTARIEAIFRNKVRRMEAVRRMISSRAVHRQRPSHRACC